MSRDGTRLERALQAFVDWRRADKAEPWRDFVSRHDELRELLEPMRDDGLTVTPGVAAATPVEVRQLGDFRLVREIGRGGMGVVYEARQTSLDRTVALKVLPPHVTNAPATIKRFRREAALAGRLEHPGIVQVHTVGEDGDTHFFVMDLVDGVPLDRILRGLHGRDVSEIDGSSLAEIAQTNVAGGAAEADSRAPEIQRYWSRCYVEIVVGIAAQVADALHHAHESHVIHRDVKPSNVIVRPDGRAVLTDFGLARDDALPSMTVTGDFAGTPYYSSPEQVTAKRVAIDRRTDVFSLGATLYELLTLRKPFDGRTSQEVLGKILAKDPTDPAKLNPQLAPDLCAILGKALEKDPDRRYASTGAMANDLRAFLDYRPVEARRVSRPQRVLRWARRNRAVASLGAALIGLFLGAVTLVTVQAWQLDRSLAQVLRLSDRDVIGRFMNDRNHLAAWHPDHTAVLGDWLRRSAPLIARLPAHRQRLDELREHALPYSDTDREKDRAANPDYQLQQRMRNRLANVQEALADIAEGKPVPQTYTKENLVQWRAEAEATLARLGDLAVERRTRSFADETQRWEHDQLRDLVEAFDKFLADDGTHTMVERWKSHTETVARRSLVDAAADWQRAVAAIAASPKYGGLEIEPQLGLVPISPDPATGLWEFAHLQTGAPAVRGVDGKLQIDEATGIVFVLLPAGVLHAGSRRPDAEHPLGTANVDANCQIIESPVHQVDLAAFFIAKYEMTQGQWLRFHGRCRAHYAAGTRRNARDLDLTQPMEFVHWVESVEICKGMGAQLPTEAQWEYAARAGTRTVYYCGDDLDSLRGYENGMDIDGRRAYGVEKPTEYDLPFRDGFAAPAPVGHYAANPWGLHDMLGNVQEWTRDPVGSYPRPRERGNDAVGPVRETVMVRGGCYAHSGIGMRCSFRNPIGKWDRVYEIGLRPVWPLRAKAD